MNNIYKLKFSQSKQQLVAVSELATNYDACASTPDSGIDVRHTALDTTTPTPQLPSALTRAVMTAGLLTSTVSLLGISNAFGHTGPQVVAGTANINTQGLVTTITNTPNTIINWDSFNISKDEIVKFVQQSASSTVLNRVLGGQVSQILGTLQSNGKVFLINPNGIVFGKNAHVDVNSLVASTLDLKNQDFLAGQYVFNQEKDHAIASVINQGMIKVNDNGTLALIGGQTVNSGMLQAKHGTVFLLAGHSIEIADLHNPLISYKVTAKNKAVNLGQIVAHNIELLGGQVLNGQDSTNQVFADIVGANDPQAIHASITASGAVELFGGSESEQYQTNGQSNDQVTGERNSVAVNNGVINVSNDNGQGGRIRVLADTVVLDTHSHILATGSTKGGTVNIGGDQQGAGGIKLARNTYVLDGQTIDVNGEYDGGKAILWGGYGYYLGGNITAQGFKGKGGFVETSGKGMHVEFKYLHVNPGGSSILNGGDWLLDPENIVVLNQSASWCPPDNTSTCDFPFHFVAGVIGFNYPGALNLHYWLKQGWKNGPYGKEWGNFEDTWYLKDTDLSAAMTADRSSSTWSPYNVTLSADKSIRFINANVTPDLGFLGDTGSGQRFLKRYYTHGLFIDINASHTPCSTATEVSFENTTLSTGYLVVNAKKHADIKVNNSKLLISSPRTEEAENDLFGTVQFNTENGNINVTNKSTIFADGGINFSIQGTGGVRVEDANLQAVKHICYTSGEKDSSFYLNNSSMVSYLGNITIHPTQNITITNTSCISAQNIDINSSSTQIFNATVRANRDIKVHSNSAFTLNHTDFGGGVSQNNIDSFFALTNEQTTQIGQTAPQGVGNVTIDGYGDTHLVDSQVTSVEGFVNLESHGGGFTSTNAKVLANKGYVRLNTTKDIVLNNTQVVSKDDLQFNVKNANFTAYNGSTVEATQGNIKLVTDYKINITDSNLSAGKDRANKEIFIVSKQGTMLTNAAVCASGLLNITSDSTQCITCSTLTGGSVNISIKDQNLVIETSNITSTAGNTTIFTSNTQVNSVNLTGVNVNASQALIVRGKTINVNNGNLSAGAWELSLGGTDTNYTNLTDVAVQTTKGSQADVNIRGNKKINLAGSTGTFYSDRDLNLSSNEGQIYLSDKEVRVGRSINITAQQVTLDSGTDLKATSACGTIGIHTTGKGDNGQLTVNGAKLTSTISSQLIAENSAVNATNVQMLGGDARIQAKNNVTLQGTKNVIFGHGAVIKSDTADVALASTNITSFKKTESEPTKIEIYSPIKVSILTGSIVNSSAGNTNITAPNVDVTGTTFNAKTETLIHATTKPLNLTNVHLTGGCATLVSPDEINIGCGSTVHLTEPNAEFSVIAGKDINITDSPLQYKKGNITATAGSIDVSNSTLIADDNINLLDARAGHINASQAVISGGVELQASTTINLSNSNVSDTLDASKKHTLIISAPIKVQSAGSNISGSTGVNVNSTSIDIGTTNLTTSGGNLNIGNGTATAVSITESHLATTGTGDQAGDINVNATNQTTVHITNTQGQSSRDLNISAQTVNLNNSQFCVTRAINITAETVDIANNSNLTTGSGSGATVGIHATKNGVTVNSSVIATAGASVEIVSNTTSNINNNSLILGKTAVNIAGGTGVSVTDSNVTATAGPVNLTAKTLTISNDTISGVGVTINRTDDQALTVTDSKVNGTTGAVLVTGHKDVTLNNTSVTTSATSGGDITVTTNGGKVALNKAPINSGAQVLVQGTCITGSAGSTVIGKDQVQVLATAGNVKLPGATISSTNSNATVQGQEIDLVGSTVTAKTGVAINATTGNLNASGGTYSTTTGNVTLSAQNNVNFDDATADATQSNVVVTATTGNFNATNSTLKTPQGAVQVKVKKDINLVNTAVVSCQAIDLSAVNISVSKASNLTATSTGAGLKLTASNNISLSDSVANAQDDIVVNASNNTTLHNNGLVSQQGNVTVLGSEVALTSSPLTAKTNVNITASKNLTFTKSGVTATEGSVVLHATENITGVVSENSDERSTITGNKDVTISADSGSVQLPSADIKSTTGNATVTAATDVNLQDSGVIADKQVQITATAGKVAASGGTYQSNTSDVIINATTDINFDQAYAHAKTGNVKFNTTGGGFTANGSTIYAPAKGVELSVAKDINLNHTNITSKTDLTLTATNINTSNGSILASTAGNTTVTADQLLNLTETSVAGNNVALSSKNDIVKISDSNATARNGNVTVSAEATDKSVTMSNFNACATNVVKVVGTTITDTGSNFTTSTGEISIGNESTTSVELTNTKLTTGTQNPNGVTSGADIGIHGKNEVKLHGVITDSGNDLNLSVPSGAVTVDQNSKLVARHIINLTAQSATLTNSNLTASDAVTVNATAGDVSLNNAPIAGKNITILGQCVTGSDGSILNATNDVVVTATTGDVKLPGAKIKAQAGNATITASKAVNLSSSSVTAGKDLNITATTGDVVATGGQYLASTGNATITAQNNVKLDSAQVCATNGAVAVTATTGNLSATSSLIYAPTKGVAVTVGKDITLDNTNVTSHDALTIKANNVTATNGTTIASTAGATTVKASNDLTLNATTVKGSDVALTATKGNISTQGTNATATSGNVSVTVSAPERTATLNNFNASAQNAITVRAPSIAGNGGDFNATTGEISIGNGNTKTVALTGYKLTTKGSENKADIGINATESVLLTDTTVNSGHDLNISSAGTVTTEKGSLTASRVINITAQDLTIANGSVTATTGDASLVATNNVALNNAPINAQSIVVKGGNVSGTTGSQLTAAQNVSVVATIGNVQLLGATIQAKAGNANMTAANNVDLLKSSVTAGTGIVVNAKNGNVSATGGTYQTTTGNLAITASQNVNFDEATATATAGNVTFTATTGNFSANNSTISSPAHGVSVTVGQNITLNHTSITAHDDLTIAANNINTSNGTTITSTGNTTVKANKDLKLNATTVTGTAVELNATTGDLTSTDSVVNATKGNVTVSVPTTGKTATLNNFSATANDSIIIRAPIITGTKGDLNATNGEISIGDSATTKVALTDYKLSTLDNGNKADIGINASESVSLTNTNVHSSHDINISSAGTVTTEKGSLNASNVINVTAQNITIANGSVSATNGLVSLVATNNVALNNAPINGNNVTVQGANVTGSQGSSIVANNNVMVNATAGDVNLPGARIEAKSGNATVVATNNVQLPDSSVTADQYLTLQAKNGSLTATGGRYTSNKSDVTLKANKDVALTDAYVTATKGNIAVNATTGNLDASNSTLYSPEHGVTIDVAQDIILNHSNVTAHDDLTLQANNINSSNGTTIASTTGSTTLTATTDLKANATTISGTAVTLNATNGNLITDGTNITTTTGNVTVSALTAGKSVTLKNFNTSANDSIIVHAPTIDLVGSNLNATTGEVAIGDEHTDTVTVENSKLHTHGQNSGKLDGADIGIHGNKQVTIGNSSLTSNHDLNIASPSGGVTLLNSTLTAVHVINITAQDTIGLTNSTLTSTSTDQGGVVSVNSTQGDINVANTSLKAASEVTVTGNNVSLTAGSTLTTTCTSASNLNVSAKQNVTVADSNLVGGKDVRLLAGDNMSLSNANISAPAGTALVCATNNLSLDKVNVTANSVELTSTQENITVSNGSVLNASTGNLTLSATETDKGIDLSHTTVHAENTLGVRSPHIAISNGSITTTTGDASIGDNSTKQVILDNLTATTDHKDFNVHASESVTVATSKLNGGQDVNIASPTGKVVLVNTPITAKRTVNITAQETAITANADSPITGENVSINTTGDKGMVLDGVTINATAGDATILAPKGPLTINNGKITAKKNIKAVGTEVATSNNSFTATTGNVELGDASTNKVVADKATINAPTGDISLHGNDNVTVTAGSTLTAGQDVNLAAPAGVVNINKESKLKAGRAINITADNLQLDNASLHTGTGNLTLTTTGTTVSKINNSDLVSNNASVNVLANHEIDFTNTSLIANHSTVITGDAIKLSDSNLTATHGEISVGNSSTNTVELANTSLNTKATDADNQLGAGEIGVHGNKGVSISGNSKVDSARSVNLSAPNGAVNLDHITVTAKRNINITAQEINLTATQAASQLNATLNATQSSVVVNDSNLTVTDKSVNIFSKTSAKVTNSILNANNSVVTTGADIAFENVTATAKNGEVSVGNLKTNTVTVANSAITTSNTTAGDVGFHGKTGVTLTNTYVTSAKDVNLSAPEGTATVQGGSKLIAKGVVNLTAQDVTLNNSIVTAEKNVLVNATAGNITVTDSNVSSTTDNTSLQATANTTLTNANVAAGSNLTVTGKNIVATGSNLSATNGEVSVGNNDTDTVSLTNTNVTTTGKNGGQVGVHGKTAVTLDNSNLDSAQSVNLSSPEGKVAVTGGSLKAKEVINITAPDVTLNNTIVTADKNVLVNATTGNLSVTNTNVTAKGGDAQLHAAGNTTLHSVNVSATENLTVTGKHIDASDSNLTATNGEISLGNNDTDTVSLTNTNVTTTGKDGGQVGVHGNKGVTLNNSNLDASRSVNLSTPNGKVEVTAGSLKAKEVINITAQDVALNNTIVTADKNVLLNATTGNLSVTNTNVTAKGGDAQLHAAGNTTLNSANVSATENLTVTGKHIDARDSNLTATNGEISIGNNNTDTVSLVNTNATTHGSDHGEVGVHGKTAVTLDNSNLDSAKSVNLSSPEGKVNVTGGSLKAKEVINITAQDVTLNNTIVTADKNVLLNATAGNLSVTNTNVTAKDGDAQLHATGNTTLNSANVSATENLTVTGKHISARDSNLTATKGEISIGNNETDTVSLVNTNATTHGGEHGEVGVHGKTAVTLENSNLESAKSVNLSSPEGKVSVTGGSLKAKEVINVTAQDVTLNNTVITAPKDVVITATNGNLTVIDTNATSDTGNVALHATGNTSLTNSNVAAAENLTITGTNISATDTKLTANKGEISVGNNSTDKVALTNITATTSGKGGEIGVHGNHEVSLNNTSLDASKSVNLSSPSGNVAVTNGSKLKAKEVINISAQNITIANATVTAEKQVAINATHDIDISNTPIHSNTSTINITATNDLKLSHVNITAPKTITVAGGHDVTLASSNLSSTNGAVNVTAGHNLTINNSSLYAPNSSILTKADTGNLYIGNGSNVTAKNQVEILAPNGNLSVVGTNVTSLEDSVKLAAKQNVTITNSNISGQQDVTVNSSDQAVTLQDSHVNATTGNVTLTATKDVTVNKTSLNASNNSVVFDTKEGDLNIGNGSNITAKNDIALVSPQGNVSVVGSNVTSTEGAVAVTAKQNVTITNSNISGKHDVTVTATTGSATLQDSHVDSSTGNVAVTAEQNVTVNNTSLNATQGKVDVTANTGDVHIGNGTNITAKEDVTVTAPKGNIDITGTNITSTDKEVTIKAHNNVSIVNSNISGKGTITVTGEEGTATLQESKVESDTGNVDVTGAKGITVNNTSLNANQSTVHLNTSAGDINLGNGTNVTAKDDIAIVSPTGNVSIVGTNVTSTEGGVTVKAKQDTTIINSNISGKHDVTVTAETGNATLQDSHVDSSTGNVAVNAEQNITVNNTSLNATQGKVDVTANTGDVHIGNGTNITAKDDVTVTAPKGNIDVTGTNITSTDKEVTIKAHHNVSIVNSNISGKGSITVTGDTGTATLQDSKVESGTGNVDVTGNKGITVNNTSLNANQSTVHLNTTAGDINLGNGTNVTAKDDIAIVSPTGNVSIVGTNVTSTEGGVTVKAKKDTTIINSNISGKHDVTVTAETGNATLQDSHVDSSTGNVAVTAEQNVTVNNTSLNATQGKVDVTANTGDVHIGNGTNITAKDDVTVTAPNGSIDITGTNITSTDKDVNITAKKDISIVNSNISAHHNITIDASKHIGIDKSSIESPNTSITTPDTIDITDSHFFDKDDEPGNSLVIGTPTTKSTITGTTGNSKVIILDGDVKESNNHWYPTRPRYPLREIAANKNLLGKFWNSNLDYLRSIVARDVGRDVEYLVIESNGQHTAITALANGKQQTLVLNSPYMPTPDITPAEAFVANLASTTDVQAFATCMVYMDDLLRKYHVTLDDLAALQAQDKLEFNISYEEGKRLYACWLNVPYTEIIKHRQQSDQE